MVEHHGSVIQGSFAGGPWPHRLPHSSAAVQARPARLTPTGQQAMRQGGHDVAYAVPAHFVPPDRRGGQRLPAAVQSKMETIFGTSFSRVRVHVSPEPAAIGALAFTHGSDLYFAPGQYSPGTPLGQRLLAHELAHVVQQQSGRVRNPFASGVAVVQDPLLEAEAQRMARRAATHPRQPRWEGRPATGPLAQRTPQSVGGRHASAAGTVQRMELRHRPKIVQAPAGGQAFPRALKEGYARIRRGQPWTANFAAVEAIVPGEQGAQILYSFNAGSGAQHSEEALANLVKSLPEGSRILTAFSDRSMCQQCQNFFISILRGRGHETLDTLYVYYIVPINQGNGATRAAAIRKWWTT